MRDLIALELLTAVNDPQGGGFWNAGDTAGFPAAVADDLIKRGAARPVITWPVAAPKSPAGPPADKAIKGPEVRRKGR